MPQADDEIIHAEFRNVEGEIVAEVEIAARSTVHALKSLAAEKISVPPICQHLVNNGRTLEDADVLQVAYLQGKNRNLEMPITIVKSFDTLKSFLKHVNGDMRQATVRMMARLSEDDFNFVFDILTSTLEDGDAAVRRASVDTLGNIAVTQRRLLDNAIATSAKLAKMPKKKKKKDQEDTNEQEVDEKAVWKEKEAKFVEQHKMCTKLLATSVADCHDDVRQSAVEALFATAAGERSVTQAVRKYLKHWNKGVRIAAAKTLSTVAKKGENEVVAALMDTLRDSDPEVRCEAAKALSQVGHQATIQKIGPLFSIDETAHTRRLALERLPDLLVGEAKSQGEEGTSKEADIAMHAAIACFRDTLVEIRFAAVECVSRMPASIGRDEALIALSAQLGAIWVPRPPTPPPKPEGESDSESDKVSEVSTSDGEGGRKMRPKVKEPPPEPPPIVIPPEDKSWKVRMAAVNALMALAPKDDRQVLGLMLARVVDPAPDVRRAAEHALMNKFAHKDDAWVVQELVQLIDHDIGDIRCCAVRLLQSVLSKGEDQPTFFEVPAEEEQVLELQAAEQYISQHEVRIEIAETKLEEYRQKPYSSKNQKAKRRMKATLLRLRNHGRYVDSIALLADTQIKALKDFVEKHEALIAEMKDKLKQAKKKETKKIYKEQLEGLQENLEYKAALKKLKPADPSESEKGEHLAQAQQAANAVDVEGEHEEEEKSDEEGLEDEDVFEHYLPDDEAEEEERRAKIESPPSPRPKGPVTALVRSVMKDDSWDVQQAALEALVKLAPVDREDVVAAVRPFVTHERADIRITALLFMSERVKKLMNEEDEKAWNLRLQDRDTRVRAAAVRALGI